MASTQSLPPLPPPKYVVDLNSPLPRPSGSTTSIPDPPGFSRKATTGKGRTDKPTSTPSKTAETDTLKLKKAWEIALAPSKQLPMNAIMMYMSGNSLQIFSIMMVFMLFKGPIQGLINTNSVFSKFESETLRGKLLGVKLIYIAMQLLLLALGIWKVNAMGLLPTTRSDWLAWESERQPAEKVYFAFN
ncbi:ER membrane protein complex subunit 4 [Aspergillus stella-maris]|uniref:ER membrane protein complex subunit 4 n=1 Tax=Aspergillus stella-maris TaxID=1810926 RepID=UPI003CCD907F